MTSRAETLRRLHEGACFVTPNPWDVGSARMLESLGFKALATTSSGLAWTQGTQDTTVSLDQCLKHLRAMSAAVTVPVTADFEGGYAIGPDDVARNVAKACETGVAGLSIEDSTGKREEPLFAFDLAVSRIRAARRAIDASGSGVWLTARSEGFIAGRPDIAETIRRLVAFVEGGADCLFAPGVRSDADLSAIVAAVAPTPVSVLVGSDFTTVERLSALGVRRISVGGALARVAWGAVHAAAQEIATKGTFTRLNAAMPWDDIEGTFAR